jgi:hypothetical protein
MFRNCFSIHGNKDPRASFSTLISIPPISSFSRALSMREPTGQLIQLLSDKGFCVNLRTVFRDASSPNDSAVNKSFTFGW